MSKCLTNSILYMIYSLYTAADECIGSMVCISVVLCMYTVVQVSYSNYVVLCVGGSAEKAW